MLPLLVCSACASLDKQKETPVAPEAARYRNYTYTALVLESHKQGGAEAARRQADSALTADSNRDALHARALGALALEDAATARTYFQKALKAQGGYSDAALLLNYGTFLCSEGKVPEGLDLLRRAAATASSDKSRIKRISATCAQPKAQRGLTQHEIPELNGFWDE